MFLFFFGLIPIYFSLAFNSSYGESGISIGQLSACVGVADHLLFPIGFQNILVMRLKCAVPSAILVSSII